MEFEVYADFQMKKGEAQYCKKEDARSRAIADPKTKATNRKDSTTCGIDRDLFKVLIGSISFNIATMTKFLLESSNAACKNKLHFIHAMKATDIVKILDGYCSKWADNIFISTDGSQFDSTRNRH